LFSAPAGEPVEVRMVTRLVKNKQSFTFLEIVLDNFRSPHSTGFLQLRYT